MKSGQYSLEYLDNLIVNAIAIRLRKGRSGGQLDNTNDFRALISNGRKLKNMTGPMTLADLETLRDYFYNAAIYQENPTGRYMPKQLTYFMLADAIDDVLCEMKELPAKESYSDGRIKAAGLPASAQVPAKAGQPVINPEQRAQLAKLYDLPEIYVAILKHIPASVDATVVQSCESHLMQLLKALPSNQESTGQWMRFKDFADLRVALKHTPSRTNTVLLAAVHATIADIGRGLIKEYDPNNRERRVDLETIGYKLRVAHAHSGEGAVVVHAPKAHDPFLDDAAPAVYTPPIKRLAVPKQAEVAAAADTTEEAASVDGAVAHAALVADDDSVSNLAPADEAGAPNVADADAHKDGPAITDEAAKIGADGAVVAAATVAAIGEIAAGTKKTAKPQYENRLLSQDAAQALGLKSTDFKFGALWTRLTELANNSKQPVGPVTVTYQGEDITLERLPLGTYKKWHVSRDSLPALVRLYGPGVNLDRAALTSLHSDAGAEVVPIVAALDAETTEPAAHDPVDLDAPAAEDLEATAPAAEATELKLLDTPPAPAAEAPTLEVVDSHAEPAEPAANDVVGDFTARHLKESAQKRYDMSMVAECKRRAPKIWSRIQQQFEERGLQAPGITDPVRAFQLPMVDLQKQMSALERAAEQLKDNGEILASIHELKEQYQTYEERKSNSHTRAAA